MSVETTLAQRRDTKTTVAFVLILAMVGAVFAGGVVSAEGEIPPEEAEGVELLIETGVDNDHACTHDEFDDRTPLDAGDSPDDAPVVTDDHVIWNVTVDENDGYVRFDNTEHDTYPGLDDWVFYYADGDLEPTDGEVLETGDVPECGLDNYAQVETPEDGVFDLQLTDDEHDHGDEGEIGEFEIIDRDTDEVTADVNHPDTEEEHWHGELPHVDEGEHLSLGANIEDADGEEFDLEGDEYSLGVELAEDAEEGVVSFDEHGDHVHIEGEEEGHTDVVFQLVHDDHVDYETPPIHVDVEHHDHDDDEIGEFEIVDRSTDEVVADVHDDHWHGELPHVDEGEHISLGANIQDTDGEEFDLEGDEYSLGVELAEGAEEGVVSFDEHGDHVHIEGQEQGHTDVVFQLVHDDHVDYETPSIGVDVEAEDDVDGIEIDLPDVVQPDGEFEFEVSTEDAAVGEVAVTSESLDVELSVVDDDGDDLIMDEEDAAAEFVDIQASDSTYVFSADVTGEAGEEGEITVATGDEVDGEDVDEQKSSTFATSYESPIDGVSDELWTAVTGDGELTLSDVGSAVDAYTENPDDAEIDGNELTLSELGKLIQYYQD